jgi:acetyl esterase
MGNVFLAYTEVEMLNFIYIITIEKDVLRDEGEQYGERLQEAGVAVTFKRFEGTIHGFLRMFPDQEESKETFQLISSFLSC